MLSVSQMLTRRSFVTQTGPLLAGIGISALSGGVAPFAAVNLKKLITEYYAAYEALDLAKMLSYYTEDCYFEDPTFHILLRSRKEIEDAFRPLKPLYQKVRFEPTNIWVSGNWLICQHVQSGTMKPKPNAEFKNYRVQGVTLFEFAGNKIKRQFDYYDVLTLRKQTGMNPNPQ